MTPNKHETDYDGKFSVVFELFSSWIANKIFYKAIPKKMRGVDLNAIPAIDDPYKKLLEGFKKKYDAVGNPTVSLDDMGIKTEDNSNENSANDSNVFDENVEKLPGSNEKSK